MICISFTVTDLPIGMASPFNLNGASTPIEMPPSSLLKEDAIPIEMSISCL